MHDQKLASILGGRNTGVTALGGNDLSREEVSTLVQHALAEATFSLRAIAESAGLNYVTVRQWSSGRQVPSPKNRERLAEAFEAQAAHLKALARELRDAG